jgi:hypothetical protein
MTSVFLYKQRQKREAKNKKAVVTDNGNHPEPAQLPTVTFNGNYIIEPYLSIALTITLTISCI